MLGGIAALEPGEMLLAVAPDPQFQPVRQRVHDRDADPVQTARDLVGILVELAARMQLGHDDLGGRTPFVLVDIHRHATAVVAHRYAGIRVDRDIHGVGMARQRLVDAVIHDLVDHVMQTRPVIGIADIHAGTFADSLQPFENLDGIGTVFFRRDGGFGHACVPSYLFDFIRFLRGECHAQPPYFAAHRGSGEGNDQPDQISSAPDTILVRRSARGEVMNRRIRSTKSASARLQTSGTENEIPTTAAMSRA